jgi:MoaA/NifB/PqqE/SkfB family radical SAM enzyme
MKSVMIDFAEDNGHFYGLEVLLGKRCNNNCLHCATLGAQNEDFDPENIKKRILLGRKYNKNTIAFSGGEPTLYDSLKDLINFARLCGYQKIMVVSNARLFSYRDFCREIINAGVDYFLLSIFSTTETIHDYISQVNDSCRQSMNGIKNLMDFKKSVYVNITITEYNYRSLYETVRDLVKMNLKNINLGLVRPEGKAEQNYGSCCPRLSKLRPILNKILTEAKFNGQNFTFFKVPYCLLNKYKETNVIPKMILPDLKSWCGFDGSGRFRRIENKVKKLMFKPKICSACMFNRKCPGIFKDYEIFNKDCESEVIPFR